MVLAIKKSWLKIVRRYHLPGLQAKQFPPSLGKPEKRRHWSWWNFRSRLPSRLCRSSKCNNFAWVLLKGNSWEEGCGEWRVHQSRSKHLPTWTLLALDRHLHLRKIGDGWRSGYLKAMWTENWRIRSINNLGESSCEMKKVMTILLASFKKLK